jgi:hypothetical protein
VAAILAASAAIVCWRAGGGASFHHLGGREIGQVGLVSSFRRLPRHGALLLELLHHLCLVLGKATPATQSENATVTTSTSLSASATIVDIKFLCSFGEVATFEEIKLATFKSKGRTVISYKYLSELSYFGGTELPD